MPVRTRCFIARPWARGSAQCAQDERWRFGSAWRPGLVLAWGRPCYITGADPVRMLTRTSALAVRRRPARAGGGCAGRRSKGCRLLPRLRDLLERLAGFGLRAGAGGDIAKRQHTDQMLVMVDDRHASD